MEMSGLGSKLAVFEKNKNQIDTTPGSKTLPSGKGIRPFWWKAGVPDDSKTPKETPDVLPLSPRKIRSAALMSKAAIFEEMSESSEYNTTNNNSHSALMVTVAEETQNKAVLASTPPVSPRKMRSALLQSKAAIFEQSAGGETSAAITGQQSPPATSNSNNDKVLLASLATPPRKVSARKLVVNDTTTATEQATNPSSEADERAHVSPVSQSIKPSITSPRKPLSATLLSKVAVFESPQKPGPATVSSVLLTADRTLECPTTTTTTTTRQPKKIQERASVFESPQRHPVRRPKLQRHVSRDLIDFQFVRNQVAEFESPSKFQSCPSKFRKAVLERSISRLPQRLQLPQVCVHDMEEEFDRRDRLPKRQRLVRQASTGSIRAAPVRGGGGGPAPLTEMAIAVAVAEKVAFIESLFETHSEQWKTAGGINTEEKKEAVMAVLVEEFERTTRAEQKKVVLKSYAADIQSENRKRNRILQKRADKRHDAARPSEQINQHAIREVSTGEDDVSSLSDDDSGPVNLARTRLPRLRIKRRRSIQRFQNLEMEMPEEYNDPENEQLLPINTTLKRERSNYMAKSLGLDIDDEDLTDSSDELLPQWNRGLSRANSFGRGNDMPPRRPLRHGNVDDSSSFNGSIISLGFSMSESESSYGSMDSCENDASSVSDSQRVISVGAGMSRGMFIESSANENANKPPSQPKRHGRRPENPGAERANSFGDVPETNLSEVDTSDSDSTGRKINSMRPGMTRGLSFDKREDNIVSEASDQRRLGGRRLGKTKGNPYIDNPEMEAAVTAKEQGNTIDKEQDAGYEGSDDSERRKRKKISVQPKHGSRRARDRQAATARYIKKANEKMNKRLGKIVSDGNESADKSTTPPHHSRKKQIQQHTGDSTASNDASENPPETPKARINNMRPGMMRGMSFDNMDDGANADKSPLPPRRGGRRPGSESFSSNYETQENLPETPKARINNMRPGMMRGMSFDTMDDNADADKSPLPPRRGGRRPGNESPSSSNEATENNSEARRVDDSRPGMMRGMSFDTMDDSANADKSPLPPRRGGRRPGNERTGNDSESDSTAHRISVNNMRPGMMRGMSFDTMEDNTDADKSPVPPRRGGRRPGSEFPVDSTKVVESGAETLQTHSLRPGLTRGNSFGDDPEMAEAMRRRVGRVSSGILNDLAYAETSESDSSAPQINSLRPGMTRGMSVEKMDEGTPTKWPGKQKAAHTTKPDQVDEQAGSGALKETNSSTKRKGKRSRRTETAKSKESKDKRKKSKGKKDKKKEKETRKGGNNKHLSSKGKPASNSKRRPSKTKRKRTNKRRSRKGEEEGIPTTRFDPNAFGIKSVMQRLMEAQREAKKIIDTVNDHLSVSVVQKPGFGRPRAVRRASLSSSRNVGLEYTSQPTSYM